MAESNQPTKGSPTREEISQLPKWARVAFAARCARRVEPLYTSFWPDAPLKYVSVLQEGIQLAEQSAAAADDKFPKDYPDDDSFATAEEAEANAASAALATYFAGHAARASGALGAGADAAFGAVTRAVSGALEATNAAFYSEEPYATIDGHLAEKAIRADFESILQASKNGRWHHDTPVPPEFFGPMWPDGTPAGWPNRIVFLGDPLIDPLLEETLFNSPILSGTVPPVNGEDTSVREHPEHGLRLSVFLPEFVDTDEASEKLLDLIRAMNAYHIACGGSGLEIEDWQMFEPADEPAEVLS